MNDLSRLLEELRRKEMAPHPDHVEALHRIERELEEVARCIDESVTELLSRGLPFTVGDVSEVWSRLEPVHWHDRTYAYAKIRRWLAAAQERGELESWVEPPASGRSGFGVRLYVAHEASRRLDASK